MSTPDTPTPNPEAAKPGDVVDREKLTESQRELADQIPGIGTRAIETIERLRDQEAVTVETGTTEAKEKLATPAAPETVMHDVSEPKTEATTEPQPTTESPLSEYPIDAAAQQMIDEVLSSEDPAHRTEARDALREWLDIANTEHVYTSGEQAEQRSHVVWDTDKRTSKRVELFESAKITKHVVETALEGMKREKEAVAESSYSERFLDRLMGSRESIVWTIAERAGGKHPSLEDYQRAQDEYLEILRGDGDRRSEGAVTKEYLLEHSVGRKIYDRLWKGGKFAKAAKIGAVGAGLLFIPGAAAVVAGAYLVAEGGWMAKYGIQREYQKTRAHRRATKNLK